MNNLVHPTHPQPWPRGRRKVSPSKKTSPPCSSSSHQGEHRGGPLLLLRTQPDHFRVPGKERHTTGPPWRPVARQSVTHCWCTQVSSGRRSASSGFSRSTSLADVRAVSAGFHKEAAYCSVSRTLFRDELSNSRPAQRSTQGVRTRGSLQVTALCVSSARNKT